MTKADAPAIGSIGIERQVSETPDLDAFWRNLRGWRTTTMRIPAAVGSSVNASNVANLKAAWTSPLSGTAEWGRGTGIP